ncbi:terminase large subunit domain-containing protein [Caminicella sporogenes]|uniref:terminase large subunit domain-containing protein n=1 Tax=Caminicella sporogenes TaxID=166485 RepID=UPI0025406867|nr:terminase large subunit [Caminicella sporogenes]WIF94309.1 terminase large subunit [Caminicella sporogenes]
MNIKQKLIKYSENVINGKIIACKKHKLACQRFLNDISKEGSKEFPYFWNEKEAQKIVKWFKYLVHSKGILAGQQIELTIFQKFVLCNIYGWYHKDTGYRRFRKAYLQVGRKNAKSQMLAGVALYELMARGINASECYCLGVKRKQSKIVWNEAKLMMGKDIKKRLKITQSEIRHPKTDSVLVALSKDDGKTGDGMNPQFGLSTLFKTLFCRTLTFYILQG